MGKLLFKLYSDTLYLVDQIDNTDYEEFLSLIKLRDEVIEELLLSNVTEEDKRMLAEIGSYDDIINKRMIMLKNEASQELDKIRTTRARKKTYEKSYASESYFFDAKK